MIKTQIQVRHAKNCSVSFPKTSEIFRLKRKSKNLDTSEYSSNLKCFLDKITCKVEMAPEDFTMALNKLSM